MGFIPGIPLSLNESRCNHYRLDYPEMDNENRQARIKILKEDDGEMMLEKQAFGSLLVESIPFVDKIPPSVEFFFF